MIAQSAPHHQLQYLEAMGLTVWTSRYRLPHAAETPACEWPDAPAPVASQLPSQRLHSLIDEAAGAPPPDISSPPVERTAPPGRMREMLALAPSQMPAPSAPVPQDDVLPEPAPAPAPVPEALSFTLHVAALDQRWLVMLAQGRAPSEAEQRFLHHVMLAAHVAPQSALRYLDFQWPMIKGLPVEDPVIEAQQGMRAFLDGRRQAGWAPERVLIFGDADQADTQALETVLQLQNVQGEVSSALLDLPVWQGPSLETLMNSAEQKRGLWPQLELWSQWWT